MDVYSVDISFGEGASRHVTFLLNLLKMNMHQSEQQPLKLSIVVITVFDFKKYTYFNVVVMFFSIHSCRVMNANWSILIVTTISSKKRANFTSRGIALRGRAVHTCTISF